MKNKEHLSLLQWMANCAGKIYLSDLLALDDKQRNHLARIIEKNTLPNDYVIQEWNEALQYLFKEEPRISQKLARKALIGMLRE